MRASAVVKRQSTVRWTAVRSCIPCATSVARTSWTGRRRSKRGRLRHAHLDLGKGEPPAMHGGGVALHLSAEASDFLGREGRGEGADAVRGTGIPHQHTPLRVGIVVIDHCPERVRPLLLRAPVADGHLPPAVQRLDHEEAGADPMPLLFGVRMHGAAGHRRDRPACLPRPGVCSSHPDRRGGSAGRTDGGRDQARLPWAQHTPHAARQEGTIPFAATACARLFVSVRRTVSRQTATGPSTWTHRSATSRTDQRV